MMIIPQTGYPSNPEEGIPEGFTAALQPIAAQMVADLVSAEGSAGTTLPEWETTVYAWLQVLGRQMIEKLMAPPPDADAGVCPQCGQPRRLVDARRPRTLLGMFGLYHLTRPYGVCPAGHGGGAAHDRTLMLGPGSTSPKLAALVARLAIEIPFLLRGEHHSRV